MYAIVRAGGRQEKVSVGDVLLIDKVGQAGDSIDLTPLLVVDGSTVTSDASKLAKVSVKAEVVKAAEHRARRIIDGAEAEARRLRLECEDFCDQKLAGFEIVLERTLKLVGSGREKLQATNLGREQHEVDAVAADQYFDQPNP